MSLSPSQVDQHIAQAREALERACGIGAPA